MSDTNELHTRLAAEPLGSVVIFAPSPLLTITVEEQAGEPDIHLHAGGQGVWQARMVRIIGANPILCASFAGETGRVLQHLITDEGFDLRAVQRSGRGAAYIHDRRTGHRQHIVETGGDPINRHALDTLYGQTLRAALSADVVLLSGPHGDRALPADVYRRLAADLRDRSAKVMVDLAGPRLDAALQGGVDIVKISHDELLADRRVSSTEPVEIVRAMRAIQDHGADVVLVTRAELPLLMLAGDAVQQVTAPRMAVLDATGAGDSFTAAVAACLAQQQSVEQAAVIGAAAGALSVTRHGLGTGDRSAIIDLSRFVQISPFAADAPEPRVRLSPVQLARLIRKGPSDASPDHE